jgi:hypothetical protein
MRAFIIASIAAAAAMAGAASVSLSQVWHELGDAGDVPQAAQVPEGSGSLTTIIGSLEPGGDADMYLVYIDTPSLFRATTCEETAVDTQLWLFNFEGMGVTFDDDDPDCGVFSSITGGFVPASGFYYLCCSAYDWDALDPEGEEIWLDEPYDEERIPDGLGAPGPVTAWGDLGYEDGAYQIRLNGVSFPNSSNVTDSRGGLEIGRLYPGTPNPFRTATLIGYEIARPSHVRVRIYEATGRLVTVLVNQFQDPARYQVSWDGCSAAGQPVTSGVYFCRIEAGGFRASCPLVLAR